MVILCDPDGRRRSVYLGPHGSAEAQRRYREVLCEHLAGKPVLPTRARQTGPSEWPTVAQLCAAFMLHAQRFYATRPGSRRARFENAATALCVAQ